MRGRREYPDEARDGRSRWSFARSGWATAIVLGGLLLVFGLGWRAHQRAKFHQLTAPQIPQTISAPTPGGQEAIQLSRVALLNNSEPEFVSITVLPGIGMQILQAAVMAPDQAGQDLLASASVREAADKPAEQTDSAPFHLRVGTHHLADAAAGEDLIGFAPVLKAENQTLVDGGQATGNFQGTGSLSDVKGSIDVTLSGKQVDIVARATSTAKENRYVAFDWFPRFRAPGNDLEKLAITVPSGTVLQGGSRRSVAAGPLDFRSADGVAVGNRDFEARFVTLSREFLSDGASVRLYYGSTYCLRIQGMGDTLRSLEARSSASAHALTLGFSSMDPTTEPERRDQTLRPGNTVQWHLRLEILPAKRRESAEDVR